MIAAHFLVAWFWIAPVTLALRKLTVMSGCGESEQPLPSFACEFADASQETWPGAHAVRGTDAIPPVWNMLVGVLVHDHEWSSFICTYADSMCLPWIAFSGNSK